MFSGTCMCPVSTDLGHTILLGSTGCHDGSWYQLKHGLQVWAITLSMRKGSDGSSTAPRRWTQTSLRKERLLQEDHLNCPNNQITVPFPVLLSTLIRSRFQAMPATLLIPIGFSFPFRGRGALRYSVPKWLLFLN